MKRPATFFLIRIAISILYFVNTPEPGFAQSDSIASNSFEKWYQQNNPSLHYSFNAEKQVHNYSGNWDLDNDGHKDQVFFIGTGGAHLYFYLRVILSTDNKTQNFTFLETDFPLLDADSTILKPNFNPVFSEANFAVYDNLFSKTKAIFLHLNDAVFSTEKDTLKKKGITTNTIVLCFKNRKPVFKNGNK